MPAARADRIVDDLLDHLDVAGTDTVQRGMHPPSRQGSMWAARDGQQLNLHGYPARASRRAARRSGTIEQLTQRPTLSLVMRPASARIAT